jgi:uncharacterized membrane protein YcaP (DUF421 family)
MILHIDLLGLGEQNLEWYQMFSRTIVVFITAIAFIRLAGMRTFGTRSSFDVVVSITLGAILSRCITGHYPFFPCLLTAMFLALLHRSVAVLSFNYRSINKIVEGDAVLLYKNGQKRISNLKKHSITENELIKAVHEINKQSLDEIYEIWLETDGKLSVIEYNKKKLE